MTMFDIRWQNKVNLKWEQQKSLPSNKQWNVK